MAKPVVSPSCRGFDAVGLGLEARRHGSPLTARTGRCNEVTASPVRLRAQGSPSRSRGSFSCSRREGQPDALSVMNLKSHLVASGRYPSPSSCSPACSSNACSSSVVLRVGECSARASHSPQLPSRTGTSSRDGNRSTRKDRAMHAAAVAAPPAAPSAAPPPPTTVLVECEEVTRPKQSSTPRMLELADESGESFAGFPSELSRTASVDSSFTFGTKQGRLTGLESSLLTGHDLSMPPIGVQAVSAAGVELEGEARSFRGPPAVEALNLKTDVAVPAGESEVLNPFHEGHGASFQPMGENNLEDLGYKSDPETFTGRPAWGGKAELSVSPSAKVGRVKRTQSGASLVERQVKSSVDELLFGVWEQPDRRQVKAVKDSRPQGVQGTGGTRKLLAGAAGANVVGRPKKVKSEETRRFEEKRRAACFRLLGLERGASLADIRQAYRALSRKFHPDVNKDADAAAIFLVVQQAYKIVLAAWHKEQEAQQQAV